MALLEKRMRIWFVCMMVVASVFAVEERPCPDNQCLVYGTKPVCVPCHLRKENRSLIL